VIIYQRAVEHAKSIYLRHAQAAAEIRGDTGSASLHEILPAHVDRQEEVLDRTQTLLESWGINIDQLKLALALTDIAKANPEVTFNALLAFEDRRYQDLPTTAVKLAMKPVGIDLVHLICSFDRFLESSPEHDSSKLVLRQVKGLSNVLLHAEAGRLMVAETIEILAQTREDLTGESGPESASRIEAYRLGAEVADQITGHDSFRAGFGKEVMPQAIGAMLRTLCAKVHALDGSARPDQETLDRLAQTVETVAADLKDEGLYPPSQNMQGFILQILDRLEALEPHTQLRYVKESMDYQGKSLSAAIKGGIHDNLSGLRKIQAQLHLDLATSQMSAVDKDRIMTSPYLKEFEDGLDLLADVLKIFGKSARGSDQYTLKLATGQIVEIENIEQFSRIYPEAFNQVLRLSRE